MLLWAEAQAFLVKYEAGAWLELDEGNARSRQDDGTRSKAQFENMGYALSNFMQVCIHVSPALRLLYTVTPP